MIATPSSGTCCDRSVAHLELGALVRAAAVLLAVALTALAAQFTIPLPFTAVPLTLTPLVVMLTGRRAWRRVSASRRRRSISPLAPPGSPVFTPSPTLPPGALRLVGPTGGYLLAYPLAAFVTGWLAERGWDRHYLTSFASMLAGLAVIFAGGVSWLAISVTQSLPAASLRLRAVHRQGRPRSRRRRARAARRVEPVPPVRHRSLRSPQRYGRPRPRPVTRCPLAATHRTRHPLLVPGTVHPPHPVRTSLIARIPAIASARSSRDRVALPHRRGLVRGAIRKS